MKRNRTTRVMKKENFVINLVENKGELSPLFFHADIYTSVNSRKS